MPADPEVHVHFLPALIPPGALDGGVAVVVDVLRATTVMAHALASGCRSIIPCLEIDEARRAAESLAPGTALLGGERQGLPIEGFDLGNSPESYTPEMCRGKTLVMTTTNGTRAILSSLAADRVLVASFPNLTATFAHLRKVEVRPIHVVCSGTDGQISLEDTLLAGAIAHDLAVGGASGHGMPAANDEARIAIGLWRNALDRLSRGETLELILSYGRGGRRVREIGLAADLAAASRIGTIPIVAELRRDPLRIEALE